MRAKKQRAICPCCGRPMRAAKKNAAKDTEKTLKLVRKFGYEIGGVEDGLDKAYVDQGYYQ